MLQSNFATAVIRHNVEGTPVCRPRTHAIQHVQVPAILESLRKNLSHTVEDWKIPVPATLQGFEGLAAVIAEMLHSDKFRALKRWNRRAEDALWVLGQAGLWQDFCENDLRVVLRVDGTPAGLLALRREGQYLVIDAIVTLQGVERGGSVLIEFAADQAMKMGLPGKLKVSPSNDTARSIYARWGFRPADEADEEMELDVTRSDRWCRADGNYRLSSACTTNAGRTKTRKRSP